MNLGVAILAAGASTRMGRPKMLLPWGKTSVLGHIIQLWWDEIGSSQTAVVCAPPPSPVPGELDRLSFARENRITNAQPERGMFSSIQTAAAWPGWTPSITHFALVLGDQPHLSPETLRLLVESARNNPSAIHQPAFRGKARHPVLLPAAEFAALVDTRASTLREFLESSGKILVEAGDPGLELDLDYPADYQAALELESSPMACLERRD